MTAINPRLQGVEDWEGKQKRPKESTLGALEAAAVTDQFVVSEEAADASDAAEVHSNMQLSAMATSRSVSSQVLVGFA